MEVGKVIFYIRLHILYSFKKYIIYLIFYYSDSKMHFIFFRIHTNEKSKGVSLNFPFKGKSHIIKVV